MKPFEGGFPAALLNQYLGLQKSISQHVFVSAECRMLLPDKLHEEACRPLVLREGRLRTQRIIKKWPPYGY